MDEKRILIIAGIVVIIVIVATFILLFSNAEDSSYSRISILGNGSVSENGTIDVKLANDDGVALKDKDITITLKDSEGNVVFNKTAKTYVNGVANVKLTNVSAGSYDVEATFAGDDNYLVTLLYMNNVCHLADLLTELPERGKGSSYNPCL